jgi:hypothetical protein
MKYMICVIKNSKVFAIHSDNQVAEIRNKYSGLDIIHVADDTNVTLGGADPRDSGATWKDARLLKGIMEIEDELLSHQADTAPHGAVATATANKIALRNAAGALYATNNPSVTNAVLATNEYKMVASLASGGTFLSDTTILQGQYLVFASYQSGVDSGDYGIYSISRWGTTIIIDTLVTATNITITVNGSYNVVLTNNTGGAVTPQLLLLKIV